MKVGPRLLALLAFGALATDVAAARHHGHRAHGHVVVHERARAATPGRGPSGKPGTGEDAIDTRMKQGPDAVRGVKGTPPAPSIDGGHEHVHQHPAGPPGGSEGAREDAIDTRITVHQGRGAVKDVRGRLFKKSKTTLAPGIDRRPERHHRPGPPVGLGGGPHRNAVGAVVERDTTAHGGALPMTVPGPASTGQPGAGASGQGSHANRDIGDALINHSSPTTVQTGNHAATVPTVTTYGRSLGGTGLIRPSAGIGTVGGPAKTAAGGISGTGFRSKH